MSLIKKTAIGCACLIVASAIFLTWWANKPVTTFPNLQGVQGASTPEPSAVAFQNDYFSTLISGNLQFKNKDEHTGGSAYEQLLWTGSSSNMLGAEQADQLAIGIANLPGDGLNGASDVLYRNRNNPLYQPIHPAWVPAEGLAFILNNPDGYEQSVFLPYDGKYASIAVTGGRTRAKQLDDTLKKVVENWQWR